MNKMPKAFIGGALALMFFTGCASQVTPKPNPTHSKQTEESLLQQKDDFSQVALENLRKASPVIDMTESDAVSYLAGLGLDARVVERDGEGLIIDTMYSNSRIDLYIKSNIVIDITVG